MTLNRVPMVRPDVGKREADAVYKAVMEGEIAAKASYVTEFEEKLADYFRFKHAVFTNSGWSALLLAVRATGYKKFVIPSFTMIATGTAVKQAGAEIEFVDVNQRGLMQGAYDDPIIKVDMYGEFSQAKGRFVIEDAAEIFGKYKYTGDIVCFSFFVNKILTTGNGGVCLTDDDDLAKEMKLFRHHYYDGNSYVHKKDGYNVSNTGTAAAMGLVQLERIDGMLARRRELGERYLKEIGGWPCKEYWYFPYLCKTKEEKTKMALWLKQHGVDTRDFFTPLHGMPPFEASKASNMFVSNELSERGILLPLFSAMTDEEQSYVIDCVLDFKR